MSAQIKRDWEAPAILETMFEQVKNDGDIARDAGDAESWNILSLGKHDTGTLFHRHAQTWLALVRKSTGRRGMKLDTPSV